MQGRSVVRTAHLRVLQLAVVLLALLAGNPARPADPNWRRLEAEHFQVLSQIGDRATVAWAREFNQFIASMSEVLHVDPRQLPPLTIVLFARDREFNQFMPPRPNGKTASLGGLTVRRPTWSVIAINSAADRDQLRATVYHEATHWLTSVDEARRPAWYNEGMAVLLSTFEYDGKKKINWGMPPEDQAEILDQLGLIPMRAFLARPGALFNHDDDTAQFYAQSWVFTHFLLFSGNPARVQLLQRFLEVYRTRSGEATVDEVFGDQLPVIERDFAKYASNQAYSYAIAEAKPVADPPPPTAAMPELVATTLGFLAYGGGHDELARDYANKAIALNAFAPGGHEVLAYLAAKNKAYDQVAIHTEAALKNGSRDSDMYMLLGHTFVNGPNADLPDAERQRTSLYERAIKLNPRRSEPYERLAEALFDLRDPTNEDAKYLAQGLRAFPGNDWIRVGAAAVADRQGRRSDAMAAMQRALLPGSTLNDRQREYATGVMSSMEQQLPK